MITIAELLALYSNIEEVQHNDNIVMVKKSQISANHLKELVDKNFIKQTTKDWYIVMDPQALPFFKAPKKKSLRYVAKVA